MVVFPNCKINIGLRILDKRTDGFHNLSTVFYPIPLKDALEVIRSPDTNSEPLRLSQSGFLIDGTANQNLCVKAYHLLKADFPQLPPVQLHLHKAIPMGAGLGGGSADGAFTLTLLNNQFKLGLSAKELLQYALKLGSDCPFFILNKPCIATGRGELLNEISLDLSGYHLLLINPGIHIDTAWAFEKLAATRKTTVEKKPVALNIAIQQGISNWHINISNDFEQPVFATHPVMADLKKFMYDQGAAYASMSGTGSSIYGLFKSGQIPKISLSSGYFIKQLTL